MAGLFYGALLYGQGTLQDHLAIPALVSSRTLAHQPPEKARKEFDQGMRAWKKKKKSDAQRHFEESVRLDPEFVLALTGLGTAHLLAHEPYLALEFLNRALLLEPDWAMLHLNSGMALLMLDHPGEAEQAARRALQIDPGVIAASYLLGLAMFTQNKITQETAQLLDVASETYPRARDLLIEVRAHLAQTQTSEEEKSKP